MKLPSFRAARARITTSADVAAEIVEHRRMLGEATADLADLDATRAEVLIGDDVATIRQHGEKSAELRMAVERLDARLGALATQAAEIAEREGAATLDARRAAVESRAAEAADWLRTTYPGIAAELVTALTALSDVEAEVQAVNAALIEADRDVGQQLAGVQARLAITLGPSAGMSAGEPCAAGLPISLGSAIQLPELVGGMRAPGWMRRAWA